MGDIPWLLGWFAGLFFAVPLAAVSGLIFASCRSSPLKRRRARVHGSVFMLSSRYVVWMLVINIAVFWLIVMLTAIKGDYLYLPDFLERSIIIAENVVPLAFGMRAARRFYRSFAVDGEPSSS